MWKSGKRFSSVAQNPNHTSRPLVQKHLIKALPITDPDNTPETRTEAEEQQLDEAVARRLAEINADRDPNAKNVPDRVQKIIDAEKMRFSIGCWVIITTVVGGGIVLYWLFF